MNGHPPAPPSCAAIASTEPYCSSTVLFNITLNEPELEEAIVKQELFQTSRFNTVKGQLSKADLLESSHRWESGLGESGGISNKSVLWTQPGKFASWSPAVISRSLWQSILKGGYYTITQDSCTQKPLTGQQRLLKWRGCGSTGNKDCYSPLA